MIGNLWDQVDADCICITTNGTVRRDGALVMGAGCALEAKKKWPELAHEFGRQVTSHGNKIMAAYVPGYKGLIIGFPVKYNWWEKADLLLIEESCKQLVEFVSPDDTCVLPRPGCGNGKLKWEDVKPILEKYLDDRFTVIHNE